MMLLWLYVQTHIKLQINNLKEFEHFHGHLHIRDGDIAEVCSHDHVLLQCTDIVLGAMFFRLNKLHLEKPEGSRVRGKRTIAKEHLYQHINARIREILPYFNIGISTGSRNYQNAYWELPYSHWKFVPKWFLVWTLYVMSNQFFDTTQHHIWNKRPTLSTKNPT